MSLQLIVQCGSVADVEAMLATTAEGGAEVFAIDVDRVGISIPTRLLDSVGEEAVRAALRRVRVYDLYAGAWTDAA